MEELPLEKKEKEKGNICVSTDTCGFMRPTRDVRYPEGDVAQDHLTWRCSDDKMALHMNYDPISDRLETPALVALSLIFILCFLFVIGARLEDFIEGILIQITEEIPRSWVN